MTKPRSIPIPRPLKARRNEALRRRAGFRLLNLAISGSILLAVHAVVFHLLTRHIG